MGIDMPAPGTFDGMRLQGFADQQSLDFSQFQRAQNPSQSGYAASIAASLTERLSD